MEKKPLKRIKELRPFSIDHHQGLLLCWKIRTGLKKSVYLQRIGAYTSWFYMNHLLPHFALEEQHMFPILGKGHDLVEKAIADHQAIRMLMEDTFSKDVLEQLADRLEAHIRFEERVLFEEIQNIATASQIDIIERVHGGGKFEENTTDEFWK
jgi:iron-sulfur cluster repair protein YtfE (RIC family)